MPNAQVTHHVTLSIGNNTYGFLLRPHSYQESDINSFSAKMASGDMRYTDQTINQTLLQENWAHGFGFREMTDPEGYAFSGSEPNATLPQSGVDTRWPHMAMMMTKATDASPATCYVPSKFVEYADQVYCLTDVGVWKWTGAAFESCGLDSGDCLDAITDGTYLYVTLKDARPKRYDGASWTDLVQEETSDLEWFAMSAGFIFSNDRQSSYVHFASDVWTDMHSHENDISGAGGEIKIGPGFVPMKALISYNNALYACREDGMWQVPDDDQSAAFRALNYTSERHSFNFKATAVFQGSLWFTIKNEIWKLSGNSVINATPPMIDFSFPYKRYGHFRYFTPAGPFLYVIASEDFGTTSTFGDHWFGWGLFGYSQTRDVLLVTDGTGWHKVADLSADTDMVSAMNYTPTNDKLWVGINHFDTTGSIYYIPFQSASNMSYADYDIVQKGSHTGANDAAVLTDSTQTWTANKYVGDTIRNLSQTKVGLDDNIGEIASNTTNTVTCVSGSVITFDTGNLYTIMPSNHASTHYLYTSEFDAMLATIDKYFASLTLMGANFSENCGIDVDYALDGGTWWHLGTFNDSSGTETIYFPKVQSFFGDGKFGDGLFGWTGSTAGSVAKRVRFRLNFQTSEAAVTPVLFKMILQYVPRPDTIYSYTMNVINADSIKQLDGELETLTAWGIYNVLKDARASKVPMYFMDKWDRGHYVFCSSLTWIPVRFESVIGPAKADEPIEVEGDVRVMFVVANAEGV
jgi:hypothetical protein